MNDCFFTPWVGTRYREGYDGLRTLVVGASHICSLDCPHKAVCCSPDGVRAMDHECPCYREKSDQDYYRLGNSNSIEIQSFIDCDAEYPAYKIFTYYMLRAAGDLTSARRAQMWDRLAFTNLLQCFHHTGEVLPGDAALYDAAVPALGSVVSELSPQVILAWDQRVKECLRRHPDEYSYLGRADMQFGLELYLFLPRPVALTGNPLRRLRYAYGVSSEKHPNSWYERLIERNLGRSLTDPRTREATISHMARTLKAMVEDGLLGASESALYFPKNDRYQWTSLLKGLFLRALKDEYPSLGRGTNPGVENMFGEKLATNKRDYALIGEDERAVARQLMTHFQRACGPGKTFPKKD